MSQQSQYVTVTQTDDLTVEDLITLLQTYPQDWRVAISGYEGGYKTLHTTQPTELLLNVNDEWYYGPHDDLDSVPDPESYQKETFLILS